MNNQLPKDWKWVKLGEVLSVSSGKGLKVNSLKGGEYPVYGGNGLNGMHSEYLIEEPKLIIGRVGVKCGVMHITKPKSWVTDNALIVEPKVDAFDLKFFKLKLGYENLNKLSVSTAQPVISGSKIYAYKILLPPKATQQQIVSKIEELFSEIDKGIEEIKTAQQQLKVYRQAILKAAFEGRLTEEWRSQQTNLIKSKELIERIRKEQEEQFQRFGKKLKTTPEIAAEELAERPPLPNSWSWCRLGEIVWSVKDGPHYSPKYEMEGVLFISGGNIRPEGINFEKAKFISKELHKELSLRCKPEVNDVLYTKGGTTGIARVNTYQIDFNVWVHVAVLKPVKSILPFYLQHVLNSNHCYKQSQKYTHGVGNQDLGLTRMVLITLPICSIEEQQQIVQEIESRLSVCDKIEETITNSLKQSEVLRQSILKKAFEGKLI